MGQLLSARHFEARQLLKQTRDQLLMRVECVVFRLWCSVPAPCGLAPMLIAAQFSPFPLMILTDSWVDLEIQKLQAAPQASPVMGIPALGMGGTECGDGHAALRRPCALHPLCAE